MPFDFGPWLPDQPSLNNPGVQVLLNGFPAARGFSAVPDATATTSPQQVVGNPAAETPIPEIVGVYSTLEVAASSIDVRTYIGTSTRLLKYDTLQNKFSQFTTSDPTYTSIPRWQFVEFATTGGTRHIYAAGVAALQQRWHHRPGGSLRRAKSDAHLRCRAVCCLRKHGKQPSRSQLVRH